MTATFRVEAGKFILDGEPILLYGGELHYFRVDPSQWPERLRLMRAAGLNLVSTYVPWMWHEPEAGQFDFTGQTHPRRNLEAFLQLCHDEGWLVLVRPGPYVMAELRNEGLPSWLAVTHPEILALDDQGRVHPTGVVSYHHPVYLHHVRQWYQAVNGVLHPWLQDNGGPVVLYQVDNEIGMLHWVSNQTDFSPTTLERFEGHLQRHPELIRPGWLGKGDLTRPLITWWRSEEPLKFHESWSHFAQHDRAAYASTLRDMARADGVSVPIMVNVHGFRDYSVISRGMDYPIGLAQLGPVAETGLMLAGDWYPGKVTPDTYHDVPLAAILTRASNRGQHPLFAAEFQSGRLMDRPRLSPQDLDLWTRLAVAHGADGVNLYMFSGGDNPEDIGAFGTPHEWQAPISADGSTRPSYRAASHLGALFKAAGSALADTQVVTDLFLGLYMPYYGTDIVPAGPAGASLRDLAARRDAFHFDGLARLLVAANFGIGGLVVDERTPIDPEKVPALFLWTASYMDAGTQRRLVDYVRAGGRLFIGPEVPEQDWSGAPALVLREALGISGTQEGSRPEEFVIEGIPLYGPRWTALSVSDDRAVVRHVDGSPVVAKCLVGQGEALVTGIALTHSYDRHVDVMRALAGLLGVKGRLALSDPIIHAAIREGSDARYLFLCNTDDVDRLTTATLDGHPLWEGRELCLPARRGLMLVVEQRWRQGVALKEATAEVSGAEVAAGQVTLTIEVTDPGSALVESARRPEVCPDSPGVRVSVEPQEQVGASSNSWRLQWTRPERRSRIRISLFSKIESFRPDPSSLSPEAIRVSLKQGGDGL